MAKLNTQDLLAQFKEMTLVELSEFVKSKLVMLIYKLLINYVAFRCSNT